MTIATINTASEAMIPYVRGDLVTFRKKGKKYVMMVRTVYRHHVSGIILAAPQQALIGNLITPIFFDELSFFEGQVTLSHGS